MSATTAPTPNRTRLFLAMGMAIATAATLIVLDKGCTDDFPRGGRNRYVVENVVTSAVNVK